jgi:sulfoxide reductase catalytic subunit YedY
LTPYKDVTTYNNFYEFGTQKTDPAQYSRNFTTRPWKVTVGGEVSKPKMYDLEELLKLAALEERIYRLRCIEAWSMVIPWIGYSLSELIKQVEPTSRAKYVEFTTLLDVRQMPGQRRDVLKWPYTEGLREIAGANPPRRQTAGHDVEPRRAIRVRFLFERESGRGSSALEPGEGAAHRRILQAPDASL